MSLVEQPLNDFIAGLPQRVAQQMDALGDLLTATTGPEKHIERAHLAFVI